MCGGNGLHKDMQGEMQKVTEAHERFWDGWDSSDSGL